MTVRRAWDSYSNMYLNVNSLGARPNQTSPWRPLDKSHGIFGKKNSLYLSWRIWLLPRSVALYSTLVEWNDVSFNKPLQLWDGKNGPTNYLASRFLLRNNCCQEDLQLLEVVCDLKKSYNDLIHLGWIPTHYFMSSPWKRILEHQNTKLNMDLSLCVQSSHPS
jgi:hypothetical protein